MNLAQIGHVPEDIWDRCDSVSIKVNISNTRPVNVLCIQSFIVEEICEIVL